MGYTVRATANGQALQDAAVAAVMPGLRDLRDDIREGMDMRVPRRTGYLATTLFSELDEQTGVIRAGARAEYADEIELGTSDTKPRPFLRETLHSLRGQVRRP